MRAARQAFCRAGSRFAVCRTCDLANAGQARCARTWAQRAGSACGRGGRAACAGRQRCVPGRAASSRADRPQRVGAAARRRRTKRIPSHKQRAFRATPGAPRAPFPSDRASKVRFVAPSNPVLRPCDLLAPHRRQRAQHAATPVRSRPAVSFVPHLRASGEGRGGSATNRTFDAKTSPSPTQMPRRSPLWAPSGAVEAADSSPFARAIAPCPPAHAPARSRARARASPSSRAPRPPHTPEPMRTDPSRLSLQEPPHALGGKNAAI